MAAALRLGRGCGAAAASAPLPSLALAHALALAPRRLASSSARVAAATAAAAAASLPRRRAAAAPPAAPRGAGAGAGAAGFAAGAGFAAPRRGLATKPRRDMYEVLGVPRAAPAADVKKAYYALVKKLHPDVNKDDKDAASKFQEVQSAYEVLSDEGKRAAYDRFGHAGVDQAAAAEEQAARGGGMGGGMGGGGGPFGGGGEGFVDAEELFSRIFGGGGGMGGGMRGARGGPQRGGDVQVGLSISFMEAVAGTTRQVSAPVLCRCDACKGSGSADGKEPTPCTTCRGSGQQQMQNGMYTVLTTCRKCGGAGSTNKNPCRPCGAAGAVRRPKAVTVTVPPGVDSGMNLRLANEGDVGDVGAPTGHLFVRVAVEPDDYFQRQGNDVHVRVPIHFTLAALGGEVGVPTLKGEVMLKVPAGSQPGDKLVMRAKGVRSLASGGLGNQVVHLDVEVPQEKQLTPKMRELLAALRDEEARVAAAKAAEAAAAAAAAAAAGAGAAAGGKGRASKAAAAAAGEGAAASWSARLAKILQRVVTGTAKKGSGDS